MIIYVFFYLFRLDLFLNPIPPDQDCFKKEDGIIKYYTGIKPGTVLPGSRKQDIIRLDAEDNVLMFSKKLVFFLDGEEQLLSDFSRTAWLEPGLHKLDVLMVNRLAANPGEPQEMYRPIFSGTFDVKNYEFSSGGGPDLTPSPTWFSLRKTFALFRLFFNNTEKWNNRKM